MCRLFFSPITLESALLTLDWKDERASVALPEEEKRELGGPEREVESGYTQVHAYRVSCRAAEFQLLHPAFPSHYFGIFVLFCFVF